MIFFILIFLLFFPSASVAAQTPATMANYWNGNASWQYSHKLTLANTGWPFGFSFSVKIREVGNTWYMFYRKVVPGLPGCSVVGTLGTAVRSSTDHGVTWSAESIAVTPVSGTAWGCMTVDGDAFYDAPNQKWRMLFQCHNGTGDWNGCYAERAGSSPMGPFTIASDNPVVTSKELWSAICNDPSDDCVSLAGGTNRVFDEGTYDIFQFDGQHFYASFHGYDGLRGYRGIAKTTDFRTWIAGNTSQGVPADAILDLHDQASWRETWNTGGPIGFGAGSIMKEGNYYYLFNEGADTNLVCISGQNWDWGIYRSTSLTNTTWEQYPLGNPIYYSSKLPESNGLPIGCTPQYGGIFRDSTGTTWLHISRETTDSAYRGIYFYKLVSTGNLLKNADLWMCREDHWHHLPASGSTNRVVYRFPNNSTDGNCYMEANCGAGSCVAGQSIYQDIDLGTRSITGIRFGGKFSASVPATNQLTVHELDANGVSIRAHALQISATTAYQEFSRGAQVLPTTRYLRFQLYLQNPANVRMDELFITPVTFPPGDLNLDTRVTFADIMRAGGGLFGSLYNIFTYNTVVTNFGR